MHLNRSFQRASLCGLLLASNTTFADDWPQWLGPKRDSVWREGDLLEKFPTNGLPVLWRVPIGGGYSGPIVADGLVYVTDRQLAEGVSNPADPFDRKAIRGYERVLCLNETDGKLLWKYEYECPYTISYPAGPRAAPLVDAGRVYTLGAEGNLYCLDARSGKVQWSKDLKMTYGIKTPLWGFAGHPLVDDDRLICLVGGQGTTVVAFNKSTGNELWRALSAEEPGYSSPMIYEAGGKRQLIVWHPEAANSLDPETGKVYWSVPFKSRAGMTLATPRKWGTSLFFTAFYSGSLMLGMDPDKPAATNLWRTLKTDEKNTTHLNAVMCTPFLQDGYIYGICSYGQLRCLDIKTGNRVWETFKAATSGDPVRWANAFIVKNGDRFFLFNELGDLIIANLTPKGYEEISRTHLLDPTNRDPGRPVVWSHPAFANRHIYARNDKEIICADLSLR
jgi:outer membrane protein assembly factor BamB